MSAKQAVRERPIIFTGEMVRAILDGRKTQTRRIIKPSWSRCLDLDDEDDRAKALEMAPFKVGQRLWVREAFKSTDYSCTEEPQDEDHKCHEHCRQTYVYYAATPRVGFRPKPDNARIVYLDEGTPLTPFYERGWKSPIHMPRWASRITLQIEDVRVQRVQDATVEDLLSEGIKGTFGGSMIFGLGGMSPQFSPEERRVRAEFADLWETIHGDGAWAVNPWVWALTFKSVEAS